MQGITGSLSSTSTVATAMYREMGMIPWLGQAEAEVSELG
jgi:hypothetical protein